MENSLNLHQMTAIGRVAMLAEFANGKKPKNPGDAEEIRDALIRFIKTGEGTSSPEADALVSELFGGKKK